MLGSGNFINSIIVLCSSTFVMTWEWEKNQSRPDFIDLFQARRVTIKRKVERNNYWCPHHRLGYRTITFFHTFIWEKVLLDVLYMFPSLPMNESFFLPIDWEICTLLISPQRALYLVTYMLKLISSEFLSYFDYHMLMFLDNGKYISIE